MIEFPERFNLTEFFLEHNLSQGRGQKVALRFEGQSITYAEVAHRANQAANLFRSLGVEQEQRVLLMLPDVPEFAYAWFGAVKMGAVAAAVRPEPRSRRPAITWHYTRAGGGRPSLHREARPIRGQLRGVLRAPPHGRRGGMVTPAVRAT